jgi:hypothetical protein
MCGGWIDVCVVPCRVCMLHAELPVHMHACMHTCTNHHHHYCTNHHHQHHQHLRTPAAQGEVESVELEAGGHHRRDSPLSPPRGMLTTFRESSERFRVGRQDLTHLTLGMSMGARARAHTHTYKLPPPHAHAHLHGAHVIHANGRVRLDVAELAYALLHHVLVRVARLHQFLRPREQLLLLLLLG